LLKAGLAASGGGCSAVLGVNMAFIFDSGATLEAFASETERASFQG
jgi:hypothetical protein